MAIVTVGVGQCGCQLAGEFIASSYRHLNALHNTSSPYESCYSSVLVELMHKFSVPTERDHHLLIPRVLLVDAEPRVADSTIKSLENCFSQTGELRLQWPGKHGSVISSSKTGSGNNFASGAFLVWPRVAEKTLNSLRKAIEKCDRCRGCTLFMSLGGGTGSGVGSTLAQHFSDAFPDVHLLAMGVLPHSSGEASTQTYNCLLSLSTLAEFADACILLPNDDIAAQCSPVTASMTAGHRQTTSFAAMNAFIADEVMSLLMPAQSAGCLGDAAMSAMAPPRTSLVSLSDGLFVDSLVENVAAHPDYRILMLDKVPAVRPNPILTPDDVDPKAPDLTAYSLVAEATWKSLFRSLSVQSRARECPMDVIGRLPPPLFILRSAGPSPSRRISSLVSEVHAQNIDALPPDSISPWAGLLGSSQPFFHGLTPPPNGVHRSVTLLGPSHRVADLMSPILTRTKCLLPKRAFVHLYEKYGVDTSYFEQSLCTLERINHGYVSHL